MSGVADLMSSGPLLLAIPVAAAAGAVTFLSPCVLPLVPGYLSYITGMSGTAVGAARGEAGNGRAGSAGAGNDRAGSAGVGNEPAGNEPAGNEQAGNEQAGNEQAGNEQAGNEQAGNGRAGSGEAGSGAEPGVTGSQTRRGRAVLGAVLFVLGFSALFATYGVAFGGLGAALARHQWGLTRALGALLIVLGLLFAGVFDRFSFAGRVIRPTVRPRAGLASAPLLGVLFGLGWSPCIGPTLGAVLTLGLTVGTAARGALLAFVYGLGIGVPFLIVAFAVERGVTLFGFARRHALAITRIGGLLLAGVGVLEVTGAWTTALTWLQVHWTSGYTPPL